MRVESCPEVWREPGEGFAELMFFLVNIDEVSSRQYTNLFTVTVHCFNV